MQQHKINTEVNTLLQSLTKCTEQLASTGKEQLKINTIFKEKIVELEQRVMLLEARNQITDKVTEIIDVHPN